MTPQEVLHTRHQAPAAAIISAACGPPRALVRRARDRAGWAWRRRRAAPAAPAGGGDGGARAGRPDATRPARGLSGGHEALHQLDGLGVAELLLDRERPPGAEGERVTDHRTDAPASPAAGTSSLHQRRARVLEVGVKAAEVVRDRR